MSITNTLRDLMQPGRAQSPIGIAWANFATALTAANEANGAFDSARDQSVEANIMNPDRDLADVAREHGVEEAREKMNSTTSTLATARTQLVNAYRAEFGDEGVRRLAIFLTALQRFGGVHPMVQIGQRGVTLRQTGPAAIRAASDDLAGLWI